MPEKSQDSTKFHVSPHVRYTSLSDRIVILDVRSESYYALEPLASAIWQELSTGASLNECQGSINAAFGPADQEENKKNVEDFARTCVNKGLLLYGPSAEPADKTPSKIRYAGIKPYFPEIRAWISLARTARSLRRKGFGAVYGEALDAPSPLSSGPDGDRKFLIRLVTAFSRAENFYHLKKAPLDCLPRSLALFFFLRSMGLPASHCIGVRRFPFTAHAWTECLGEVVHDDGANRSEFVVIARIDP